MTRVRFYNGSKRPKNWWNDECRVAVLAKRKARKMFQKHPSLSTAIFYKQSCAKVKLICRRAKQSTWLNFSSSISFRTPISKVHNFISQLNSGKQPNDDRGYDIIQDGYPIVSDKKKVDPFTYVFKNDCSDFHPSRPPFCNLPLTCSYKGTLMKPFSQDELCVALNSLNIKSSPGYDGIYMKWILESPKVVHTALLSLYNLIWSSQKFPDAWKIAQVFPALKPSYSSNDLKSYHHISVLPSFSKVLERLVLSRIEWFSEVNNLFPSEQTVSEKDIAL